MSVLAQWKGWIWVLLGSLSGGNLGAAPRAAEGAFTFISTPTKLWTEPTQFGEGMALLEIGLPVGVIFYSSSRAWIKVRTPAGREGWVPARFTSQSARRSRPVNTVVIPPRAVPADVRSPASPADAVLAVESPSHLPLTVPERERDSQVPEASSFDEDPTEFHLGLDYLNELSRENAHGFGLQVGGAYRIGNNWAVGAGLDWALFMKNREDKDYRVERSTHRFYPHALARFRYGQFRLDLGLGVALDRTRFTSKDLESGETVLKNPDGDLVSGAEMDTFVGLKISPKYYLPLSEGMRMGFYLHYAADMALSGAEGDFAATKDETASRLQHLLGAGLLFSMNL